MALIIKNLVSSPAQSDTNVLECGTLSQGVAQRDNIRGGWTD